MYSMSKPKLALISSAICLIFALPSSANDQQFRQIDELIHAIKTSTPTSSSAKGGVTPVVTVEKMEAKPVFGENVIADNPKQVVAHLLTKEPVKEVSSEHSRKDASLNVRFTEMPPYTSFSFNRKVFIPAYKAGVILRKGVATYNIDDKDKLTDLFSAVDNDDVCALLSSRSYVMMSNETSERPATELNVKSVSVHSFTHTEGKPKYLAQIDFEDKPAVNSDNNVAVSLVCLIPGSIDGKLHEYRLAHLDTSLNGLFTINMPKFIEL